MDFTLDADWMELTEEIWTKNGGGKKEKKTKYLDEDEGGGGGGEEEADVAEISSHWQAIQSSEIDRWFPRSRARALLMLDSLGRFSFRTEVVCGSDLTRSTCGSIVNSDLRVARRAPAFSQWEPWLNYGKFYLHR